VGALPLPLQRGTSLDVGWQRGVGWVANESSAWLWCDYRCDGTCICLKKYFLNIVILLVILHDII
jgi:hypothetical protein